MDLISGGAFGEMDLISRVAFGEMDFIRGGTTTVYQMLSEESCFNFSLNI